MDLDLLHHDAACNRFMFEGYGLMDRPAALWREVPPVTTGVNVLLRYAKLGKTAESIQTSAEVTLLKTDAGFTVTAVHLKVKGKVPDWEPAAFKAAAEAAKNGCPISRLLKADITLDARLEGWT